RWAAARRRAESCRERWLSRGRSCVRRAWPGRGPRRQRRSTIRTRPARGRSRPRRCSARSEEHTSELQSRENLVCRLLLEKKKYQNNKNTEENSVQVKTRQ